MDSGPLPNPTLEPEWWDEYDLQVYGRIRSYRERWLDYSETGDPGERSTQRAKRRLDFEQPTEEQSWADMMDSIADTLSTINISGYTEILGEDLQFGLQTAQDIIEMSAQTVRIVENAMPAKAPEKPLLANPAPVVSEAVKAQLEIARVQAKMAVQLAQSIKSIAKKKATYRRSSRRKSYKRRRTYSRRPAKRYRRRYRRY